MRVQRDAACTGRERAPRVVQRDGHVKPANFAGVVGGGGTTEGGESGGDGEGAEHRLLLRLLQLKASGADTE